MSAPRDRTAEQAPSEETAYDVQPYWGADASTPLSAHACNCIGCCPKCGTCRTWHGHTAEYCALLVRQARERMEALGRGGAA